MGTGRAACGLRVPGRGGVRLKAALPYDAQVWIQTALSDPAIWPGQDPIDLSFRCGDAAAAARAVTHPNQQGLYSWYGGRCGKDEKITLSLRSKRGKVKFFCYDLFATEADP